MPVLRAPYPLPLHQQPLLVRQVTPTTQGDDGPGVSHIVVSVCLM